MPVETVSSSTPSHERASAGPSTHSSLRPHSLWSRSLRLRASIATTSPMTSGTSTNVARSGIATTAASGGSTEKGAIDAASGSCRRSSTNSSSATPSATAVGTSGVPKLAMTVVASTEVLIAAAAARG